MSAPEDRERELELYIDKLLLENEQLKAELVAVARKCELRGYHIERLQGKLDAGGRKYKVLAEDRDWYRNQLKEVRRKATQL